MRKKYTLLILLLSVCSACLFAEDLEVKVLYRDGNSRSMQAAAIERIEVGSGTVNLIPKEGEAVTAPVETIDKILFARTTAVTDLRISNVLISLSGIQVSVAGASADARLEIFTAAGQLLDSAPCHNGEAQLSIEHYPQGVYILKVDACTQKFYKI